ncbi:hypothetical protein [Asanoa iriomotensis]|uniref:Uncharacterized protein n=1 Tax=Asanoa iriomotensis TaxID=234613 RepID=A0ABQ4BXP3_9ACTN|nr:hypothetical protein [Asanoa iriomotensis]GIF55282.1 hypothetical protein Air01nite_13770 [Asanoa iriomotensis]
MDWLEQRRRAVDAHARAQRDQRAREADEAKELIDAFVADAAARGIAPTALTAPADRGRTRYRTGLRGWYLDRHDRLAVDTEGRFYVLTTRNSLRARFTGVTIQPRPAPLRVGEGGRDGDSIPLRDLLQRRLDAARSS